MSEPIRKITFRILDGANQWALARAVLEGEQMNLDLLLSDNSHTPRTRLHFDFGALSRMIVVSVTHLNRVEPYAKVYEIKGVACFNLGELSSVSLPYTARLYIVNTHEYGHGELTVEITSGEW